MNPQRKRRLIAITLIIVGMSAAAALTIYAFNRNMMFYFKPAQVISGEAPMNATLRVGGLVVAGSVHKATDSPEVRFVITDLVANMSVKYNGVLPDLFREGQGVVVKGRVDATGVFEAEEVLAKHDEKYMPPEVAASLPQDAQQR